MNVQCSGLAKADAWQGRVMMIVDCAIFLGEGRDRPENGKTHFLKTFGHAVTKYSSSGIITIPNILVHINIPCPQIATSDVLSLLAFSTHHSPTPPPFLVPPSCASHALLFPLLRTSFATGYSIFSRGHDLGVGNTGRAGLMFGADERKDVVRVVEGGPRRRNVSTVLLLRNLYIFHITNFNVPSLPVLSYFLVYGHFRFSFSSASFVQL